MDELGVPRLEGIGNTFRRKRTQTSRRPKPEAQALPENHHQASLSPSDDASKISSDENAVDANPKRKVFNLNQCDTKTEGERSSKRVRKENGRYSNGSHSNGGSADAKEGAQSGLNHNGGASETKVRNLKLKVGGVTRTIQTKSSTPAVGSDAPRQRPKSSLQGNSEEEKSPAPGKKIGLQGIPWKDFSRGGFSLGRENASMVKNNGGQSGEKSDRVRKSKRVQKKRSLDGDLDEEDDDEIRYLEKLKTVKVAVASRDFDDDSGKKHRSLSRVSRDDPGSRRSGRDGVSADTDYEEAYVVSDNENEENRGKKPRKESPDSPNESKRETALTSRQRALLSGRDSGSAQIEFPDGLPPAPSRKQKEKLTEVEQQLKKAEAAERRRAQNAKAARESEAEAIRKILGQDSTRKKREDKLKKRQEELAQEKAANAKVIAPNTIRTVFSPTGTTVAFAEDIGLPHIFDPKPTCYPPPREKCAGPSCTNAYKYRDSKSKLPLCSLQCYKAIHERMQAEIGC